MSRPKNSPASVETATIPTRKRPDQRWTRRCRPRSRDENWKGAARRKRPPGRTCSRVSRGCRAKRRSTASSSAGLSAAWGSPRSQAVMILCRTASARVPRSAGKTARPTAAAIPRADSSTTAAQRTASATGARSCERINARLPGRADRHEVIVRAQEDASVGEGRARRAALADRVAGEDARLAAPLQHDRVSGLAHEVDAALGRHRGCREDPIDALLPDLLAGLGIDARDDAGVARHVEEAVVIKERGDVGRARGDAPEDVALRDVAAAARAHGEERAAPVPATRVEDAVVERRHRDGEAVALAGPPQEPACLGVVGVDPRGRVHDHLVALRSAHDGGRAVRDRARRPLDLEALLAGRGIEGEEVRPRLVVAQQVEDLAVERGRAAVAPVDLEGTVLAAEVALPDELALDVERHELPVSEPRVHAAAVGDRARAREVVLLVHLGQLALGRETVLPETAAVRARERLDEELDARCLPRIRGAGSQRLLVLRFVTAGERRVGPRLEAAPARLRSHEHAVVHHDGRRDAETAELGFPCDALRVPANREGGVTRGRVARRAAPLWPVRSVTRGDRGQGEQEPDLSPHGTPPTSDRRASRRDRRLYPAPPSPACAGRRPRMRLALIQSRFMRAMFSTLIRLGQAASHSKWFVQWPKPSASICATILSTRSQRSGWPCGRRASWEILAEVKSDADALGQAATQAPQPMQAAASIARSAFSLGTGRELPSGALPVGALTNPPAAMIRSNADRSTTRSLITGKAAARQGSHVISSPSANFRMWSWQAVTPRSGPWGEPLITMLQVPQIPSRQSWSKAIGSSPLAMRPSFTTSSISRNDMSGLTSFAG